MTDEHKKKLKEAREKAKLEKEAKFVSKGDFDSFKTSIVGILENISNQISANAPAERRVLMATEPEKPVDIGSLSHENSAEPVVHNLDKLSPRYQAIFERYFDPEDGFTAMLKGISFKIGVPLKLSNAQDAHKTYYKNDIRHKVLDGHDIEGTMERYCKVVAHNLNYKRNIRLKL